MNKKGILAIISITVLVAVIAIVTFLFLKQKKENTELTELFAVEKEEMENEYSRFATQYDELQFTINNDSLANLLDDEKVKVQRLLEELRSVKSTNASEINRLRKELNTVRAVLRTYIIQIDSLSRLNQALTVENKEVKQKYNEANRQISNLSEEKKDLHDKVSLAAQLDATNIWVEAKNKRDKIAKKVKDVVKFTIGFTVVKNITAQTGERTLYVRITKPDNDVLTKKASDTFAYENRELAYSIKKYIEYNGEEQQVTLYWKVEEFLYAGTYRVDIFTSGTLIGSGRFTLQ
ncbi:MAG: hypothetical protein RSA44_01480 [Bacteroides sp.]